jgi:hypothetical protein
LNKTSTFQLNTLFVVCFSVEKFLGIFQYLPRGQLKDRKKERKKERKAGRERQTDRGSERESEKERNVKRKIGRFTSVSTRSSSFLLCRLCHQKGPNDIGQLCIRRAKMQAEIPKRQKS